MKYLAYSILGVAWLAATVVLVFSFVGILVLIFSETWWSFGKEILTEMRDKRNNESLLS